MLAFNVKTTEPVPVEERLRRHVDTSRFPSGHAFLKDLQGWREKMRSQRFGTNGAEAVRDGQLRYYALATHAEHHFRTVDLKNEAKVVFRWYDTFSTRRFVDQPDWAFERASVLFNVAGALSYLATSQERGDPEQIKLACRYFQEASGVINELRKIASSASWLSFTPDMTDDFLEALSCIMLAQAQKCFYEKAVADGRSHAIVAKLAAECAALYQDAGLKLKAPLLQEAISSEWLAVVDWNRALFDGVQNYYAATALGEAGEYGACVSRLTHAVNRTAEAVNMCQRHSAALQKQFRDAHALAKDAHAKAKKDNDSIYFDRVPPYATLPKLPRHALVKPLRPEGLDVPPPEAPPSPEKPDIIGAAAAFGAASLEGRPPPPSFDEASSAGVEDLVAMGFSKEAASAALAQCKGSVQEAAALLVDS